MCNLFVLHTVLLAKNTKTHGFFFLNKMWVNKNKITQRYADSEAGWDHRTKLSMMKLVLQAKFNKTTHYSNWKYLCDTKDSFLIEYNAPFEWIDESVFGDILMSIRQDICDGSSHNPNILFPHASLESLHSEIIQDISSMETKGIDAIKALSRSCKDYKW